MMTRQINLTYWYDRGAKAGPATKKYRKGACENNGYGPAEHKLMYDSEYAAIEAARAEAEGGGNRQPN